MRSLEALERLAISIASGPSITEPTFSMKWSTKLEGLKE